MDEHGQAVRRMFASIAPWYDLLNHLLSFNQDRRWRRAAARVALNGTERPRILDLCAGTGDLSLALIRHCPQAHVVALDFVYPMLRRAASKRRRARADDKVFPLCGDSLRLPLCGGSFDLVTVAFGLRNVSPIEGALREAARVLRPGGRLVILDFSLPGRGLWRRLYCYYFFGVLPKIGRWISGTSAYSYLPASVALFAEPRDLAAVLEKEGFTEVGWRSLSGGIVAIHTARVKK